MLSLTTQVRNEKARRFLMNMRRKPGVNLAQYFPRADHGAVALLKKMLVRCYQFLCDAQSDPRSCISRLTCLLSHGNVQVSMHGSRIATAFEWLYLRRIYWLSLNSEVRPERWMGG